MRVAAVVVSYEPRDEVQSLIRVLAPQVWRTIVVDNGSTPGSAQVIDRLKSESGVSLVRLERNYGIGYAQNRGIDLAKSIQATHVLLLDQDSTPDSRMVANLARAEENLLKDGTQVGALGPVFVDEHTGKPWPFYRLSALGLQGRACPDAASSDDSLIVPCDFLISSGTFIRLSVLERTGGMNENYFLEHVDTEWSLRARSLGYRLFGACQARMRHSLGDGTVKVPLSDRRTQLYQPYRQYYLFRNALLLARQDYAVFAWKLNEARRLFLRFLFFSLIVPPRLKRLKMMLLGLWHGLRGKSGPLAN